MRRSENAARLKALAQVRDLQRLRAEAGAAKAASALHDRNNALAIAERDHESDAESWLASVTGTTIFPEIVALWSRAVCARAAAAQTAAQDMRAAAAERDRLGAELHVATIRRDAICDRARKAHRDQSRKQDELALQDALDIHVSRGRRS